MNNEHDSTVSDENTENNKTSSTDENTPFNQTNETTPTDQIPPTDQQVENEQETEMEEETGADRYITPFTQNEWDTKREKLKQQFPQLTEEDLNYQDGKHTELYARIENRLDKTNYEVRNLIDGIDKAGL